MRYLMLLAIVVAATAMPAGNYAEAAKKTHKPRYYHYGYVPEARPPYVGQPQWGWGLGAAGGNNANSMYGSNSAVNNPIGRTSGGRGM